MKQNQIFQGYVLGQNGILAIFHMKHKHKKKFTIENKTEKQVFQTLKREHHMSEMSFNVNQVFC